MGKGCMKKVEARRAELLGGKKFKGKIQEEPANVYWQP